MTIFLNLLFCDRFAYISLVLMLNFLKVHRHEFPISMVRLCTPHNSIAKRTSYTFADFHLLGSHNA